MPDVSRGRGHALQGGVSLGAGELHPRRWHSTLPTCRGDYKQGVVLGELAGGDEAWLLTRPRAGASTGSCRGLEDSRLHLAAQQAGFTPARHRGLQRALALDPNLPYGAGAVLHLKTYAADWEDFDVKQGCADLWWARLQPRGPALQGSRHRRDDPGRSCGPAPGSHAQEIHPPVAAAPHEMCMSSRAKPDVGLIRSGEFREQATAILMQGFTNATSEYALRNDGDLQGGAPTSAP